MLRKTGNIAGIFRIGREFRDSVTFLITRISRFHRAVGLRTAGRPGLQHQWEIRDDFKNEVLDRYVQDVIFELNGISRLFRGGVHVSISGRAQANLQAFLQDLLSDIVKAVRFFSREQDPFPPAVGVLRQRPRETLRPKKKKRSGKAVHVSKKKFIRRDEFRNVKKSQVVLKKAKRAAKRALLVAQEHREARKRRANVGVTTGSDGKKQEGSSGGGVVGGSGIQNKDPVVVPDSVQFFKQSHGASAGSAGQDSVAGPPMGNLNTGEGSGGGGA